MLNCVALPNRGLARCVAVPEPAGEDDAMRQSTLEEVDRVVESRPKNRRWASDVLRRPEHHDRRRGPSLVALLPEQHTDQGQDPRSEREQGHREREARPVAPLTLVHLVNLAVAFARPKG